MNKILVLILFASIGLSSCDKYKELNSEELKVAFILNSSATFKGYYYQGSDKDYHYFVSKWDYQKDKYFKIAVDKIKVINEFKFQKENHEIRVDVYNLNNKVFAVNEFCKLYIVGL